MKNKDEDVMTNRCFRTWLLGLLMLFLIVPAAVQAASKTSVPKKVTSFLFMEDNEEYMKTSLTTIGSAIKSPGRKPL